MGDVESRQFNGKNCHFNGKNWHTYQLLERGALFWAMCV